MLSCVEFHHTMKKFHIEEIIILLGFTLTSTRFQVHIQSELIKHKELTGHGYYYTSLYRSVNELTKLLQGILYMFSTSSV